MEDQGYKGTRILEGPTTFHWVLYESLKRMYKICMLRVLIQEIDIELVEDSNNNNCTDDNGTICLTLEKESKN